MREPKKSRRRKAPANTEWHGDTLYGRIRIKGKLKRWSLRTGDVEFARQVVAADIERLKAEVFHPDHTRIRYEDMFASWAEKHIAHEVSGLTVKRYATSLKQLEPFLRGKFKDEIDKGLISAVVDARRAAGVSTATIKRDLGALASVLDYNEVEPNPARDRLKKLKERRDPIVLPEAAHIERMVRRAPGCMASLVHVAWLTGCRLDELVGAERAKLDHPLRQPDN
jgi:integrase/recombinase XerD